MDNINYALISFEELVAQIQNKLKEKNAWKDIYISSTSTAFIETFAYAVNNLMFYLQRTFEEHFIDTAVFWSSLVRIAKLLNYKIRRPIGSTGMAAIYPTELIHPKILIPENTKIITSNGLLFFTTEEVSLEANETHINTIIMQGVKNSVTFDGTGLEYQEYNIGTTNTTDYGLIVTVDTLTLTRVDSLASADGTGFYESGTNTDGTIFIRFGSAYIGGIPGKNSKITISYYETLGSNSNYLDTTNQMQVIDISNVYALLAEPCIGGDSLETAMELKKNIPATFSAGQRCVTKQDFEAAIDSLAGIKKCKAIDIKDSFGAPFRTINLYVLPIGGNNLTEGLKTRINTELHPKMQLGIQYRLLNPVLRDIDVKVNIKYNTSSGVSLNACKAQVDALIRNLYDIDNITFGQWISIYKIVNDIESLSSILSCTVMLPAENIDIKEYELLNLMNIMIEVV